MRNTVLLVLGLASFSLSGCVMFPMDTTATPEHLMKAAPRERLLAFQEQGVGATATLVVTRDVGAFGSACYYAVELNGTLAARLDMAERSYFHLGPGEATLRAGGDPLARGLCSMGQGKWSEQKVLLQANEPAYFRLSLRKIGEVVLKRTGP